MKKWIQILLIIALVLPQAIATECQISENNVTFIDVTSDLYGGSINEIYGIANVQNLKPDTKYYFRCRTDELSSYSYVTFTTDESWSEENMLSIIIGYIALIIFFIFVGVTINPNPFNELADDSKDNNKNGKDVYGLGLKFFFFGIAFFETLFLVWIIYADYMAADLSNILFVNFWIMMIIGLAGAFISVWKIAQFIWKPDHLEEEKKGDDKWT